jgi:hypothetical protein
VANCSQMDEQTCKPLPEPVSSPALVGMIHLKQFPSLMLTPGLAAIVFDRQRVPLSWHETKIAEDILFLLESYQYLPSIYRAQQCLYRYYRRSGSVTRDVLETANLITHKEKVIADITTGLLFTVKPDIGQVAKKYFRFSLAAKQEYVEALKTNDTTEFTMFLAKHFQRAGLI